MANTVVLFFNVLTCYALTETDIVQSISDDRNLGNDEESSEDEENEITEDARKLHLLKP